MKVIDVQYVKERGELGFLLDTGSQLFYGSGVLPGTDVPTYHFAHSYGFDGSQEAYQEGKAVVREHSRGLGFASLFEHLKSFTG